MHFYTIVAYPPTSQPVEEVIEILLAPYNEHNCKCYETDEDANCTCGAFWDWYQIGGRWTGELTDSYDPRIDPANVETCHVCKGSGVRPNGLEQFGQAWFDACGGCNGCQGLGASLSWPTNWAKFPGDVARLGDVRDKLLSDPPYHLVAGERLISKERWEGVPDGDLVAELTRLSDSCVVVVVDVHS